MNSLLAAAIICLCSTVTVVRPTALLDEQEYQESAKVLKSFAITQTRDIFDVSDALTIEDAHNVLRANIAGGNVKNQPGAKNMLRLTWNFKLAQMASDWANTCVYQHGQPSGDYNSGYNQIGQNIAAGTGDFNSSAAVINWYNEVSDYNYDTNSCQQGRQCGHYTQIVWAETKKLGCGYKRCAQLTIPNFATWENAWFFVCNYGPAGNYQGEKPYKVGSNCEDCPKDRKYSCLNNLCTLPNKRSEVSEEKGFRSVMPSGKMTFIEKLMRELQTEE